MEKGNRMANAILKKIPAIKLAPSKKFDARVLAFADAGLSYQKGKRNAAQEGWIL